MEQAKFYLAKGIQPEVWPTEEEFQLAKNRVQCDPEKLHFAVCGSSQAGSGKSSLINVFCGLKNSSPQAARAGVGETTKDILTPTKSCHTIILFGLIVLRVLTLARF